MRISYRLLGPLIFGGLFLFGCTNKQSGLENTVVVRVNRSCEMTTRQLAEDLARRLKDIDSLTAKGEELVAVTKNSIINEFIVGCLTRMWAKENGIFVRKEQLDAEIDLIKGQYPDEITFRQSLIDADITYEQWVQLTESKVLEKLVTEKVREKVSSPSSDEVRSFYSKNTARFQSPAQMRVSQIVLKTEDQAKMIDDQLRQGKDFAQLAKKYSISPEGPDGGDLGWVERDTHEMFEQVYRLGIGQRTKIIKTPFGFHILKLVGKRPARTKPLAEVDALIKHLLSAKLEQHVYSQWLEAEILRSQVYKNEDVIRSVRVLARGK